MPKMLYVSLVCIALYCPTSYTMFGALNKRKASAAKSTEVVAQLSTGPTQLSRSKSLDNIRQNVDPLRQQLRRVLNTGSSDSSVATSEEDNSEQDSGEPIFPTAFTHTERKASPPAAAATTLVNSSGETSPYNYGSPVLVAPTKSPRDTLKRSRTLIEYESGDAEDSVHSRPATPEESCKACTNAYHGRNELGLMLEWIQKLPADQIEFNGGNLDDGQKEQLLALLKSIPQGIKTNIDSDDDTERVIVDLRALVSYHPLDQKNDIVHNSHKAPALLPQVELDVPKLKAALPEETDAVLISALAQEETAPCLAELNARHLFAIKPANILLIKDGVVQPATLAQKTIVQAWILQALHAISIENKDGMETLYVNLSQMPKDTKVPGALKKTNQNAPPLKPVSTPTSTPNSSFITHYAPTALKGLGLIGVGYLLAQLLHK